jgi:crossover junction endodeoxyribonuclease RuvC
MTQTPSPVRYLGIDPGLQRTGYALVERGRKRPLLREGGVIRSSKEKNLAERIAEIGIGIREILEQYAPQAVVIEKVFTTPRFPKTALLLAHVRGAILFSVAERGIPVVHYTPTQVKRLLTGSGKASKEQMQHAVRTELGLENILEPHDVADAFAIALCHYHTHARMPQNNITETLLPERT